MSHSKELDEQTIIDAGYNINVDNMRNMEFPMLRGFTPANGP